MDRKRPDRVRRTRGQLSLMIAEEMVHDIRNAKERMSEASSESTTDSGEDTIETTEEADKDLPSARRMTLLDANDMKERPTRMMITGESMSCANIT